MAKISFWELLTKYEVVIPIIQRDYAQGRRGKEHIREKFLTQIKNALDNSNQSGELDFVYGTAKDGRFYPLDGQQRLTTLWLLHWFIASKAGKLQDAKETLKKFSYETRTSSREFCKKLCEFDISNVTKVADAIQKQTWFYAVWKQDPTIQSMLRMLEGTDAKDEKENDFIDGIEELFHNCSQEYYKKAWDILTRECVLIENYPVKFSKLEIKSTELPVSDDLYIKMNARGKALSSFENFKAELVDYIQKQAKAESADNNWKNLNDPRTGFGQKLDNAWMDIFWKYRSKDDSDACEYQNRIDEIYFAFFNRFFFNYQALQSTEEKWNELPLYANGKDETLGFTTLNHYSVSPDKTKIPLELFQDFSLVLNNWSVLQIETKSLNPSWKNDKGDFFFIPEYKKEQGKLSAITDNNNNELLKITHITVKGRVVFFAICQWLKKNIPSADMYSEEQKSCFEDWMRIVWNIVENSSTDSNFTGALKLIEELSEHSADIIAFLKDGSSEIKSQFAKEIIICEQQKAKIIDMSPALKEQIISMEKDEFMHGDIAVQLYETKDSVIWEQRHKKLLEYKETIEKKRFQFSKDLLTHLEDYTQLNYCFMQGDFVFNAENFHRLVRHTDICAIIANMLDGGEKRKGFSWEGHEPTVERILYWLTQKDTLDVFHNKGYEKNRLQWVGTNLYLHQKGKWYGYFLLNSPLYDILNSLMKKGDIQISNDQMWDGIFNRNIVEFTWNGIKFCSNGTSVWKNEFPDNKLSLFTEGENPACRFNDELANKFLYCCEKLCEKTR